MKHPWNDALAAFDRELPLLKALRAEYDAYLRERYELVIARVQSQYPGRAAFDLAEDDGELSLGMTLLGPLADAGLDLRVWPAAGYGGEGGNLRWGVYLKRQLGEGFPPLDTALARSRAAFGGVPVEVIASAPGDVLNAGDAECVRWGSLDIGAPNLAERLTERLGETLPAMEAAAEAILALRVTTPRAWLESILRELKADGSFVMAGATAVTFGSWAPGMTLNVRVGPGDYGWFTPYSEGCLAFHWEPPAAEKSARRSAILARVGPLPALDQGKWHGVLVLSAAEVNDRQARGDREGVRAVILDTWGKYREACSERA